jgi:hypothetical protein
MLAGLPEDLVGAHLQPTKCGGFGQLSVSIFMASCFLPSFFVVLRLFVVARFRA